MNDVHYRRFENKKKLSKIQRRANKRWRIENHFGNRHICPKGKGAQSPKIVVIQNPDTIKEFSAWNRSFFPVEVPEDVDPFYGCKTLLIVLADSEVPTYRDDGSSVMTVLVNAAHAVGVGSCWIYRAREEFDSEKGKELLKEWGIPESYKGIGHVALGYVDGGLPPAAPRKEDYILYVD